MIGIEPTSALEPKPQPAARHREGNLVFDYRALRFVVGLLAFIFPWVVTIRAQMILSSISWSYHTDARDQFVGGMCVIGILLIAYKGHKPVLPPEPQSLLKRPAYPHRARFAGNLLVATSETSVVRRGLLW